MVIEGAAVLVAAILVSLTGTIVMFRLETFDIVAALVAALDCGGI